MKLKGESCVVMARREKQHTMLLLLKCETSFVGISIIIVNIINKIHMKFRRAEIAEKKFYDGKN